MKKISELEQEQKDRLLCETLAFQCRESSDLTKCPGRQYFDIDRCPFWRKPCSTIKWEDWNVVKVNVRKMK